MSENWLNTLGVELDATGPADTVALSGRRLRTTGAILNREPVARFLRRNARRQLASTYPLFNDARLRFEFEVGSNLDALLLCLASLADARSTATLFRFGSMDAPVRRNFISEAEDGQHLELLHATCESLSLTLESRGLLKGACVWPGWHLTAEDSAASLAEPAEGASAACLDCSITLGSEIAPVFSGSWEISRDVAPAGYDGDGRGTAWAGTMAVDVVGKLALRASYGVLDDALLSSWTDSLTLSVQLASGQILELSLPAAILQARSKTLVGRDLWEYSVEFVASHAGSDVCTVEIN